MNIKEHLLTLLSEECAELIKTATKSQRFGLEYVAPNGCTNHDNLITEYHDVIAIIELLHEKDYIKLPDTHEEMCNMILAKTAKTIKFIDYSKELGYLTND